jgi:outer membrane biosynthesis protein TonB
VGEIVVVTGLQGAPQHNGRQGVVERFDRAKGRFVLKVQGRQKPLAVRPDNLLRHPLSTCNTEPEPAGSEEQQQQEQQEEQEEQEEEEEEEEDEEFQRLMAEMQGQAAMAPREDGSAATATAATAAMAAAAEGGGGRAQGTAAAGPALYEMNAVRWTIVRMAFCR